MIAPEALRTLRSIDWDFVAPRTGYVGPPHWYPGTFVPALSDTLIETLTPSQGSVFDPYGGIGTTGWSAVRTGRSCQIADLNPVAVLASYVSITLLAMQRQEPESAQRAVGVLSAIAGRNDDLFGTRSNYQESGSRIDENADALGRPSANCVLQDTIVGPPNWDALSDWFADETLRDIQRLLDDIGTSDSCYVRLLGLCMLSAVARSLSSQHASWGHIADNVKPRELRPQNVHVATGRWLKRTSSFLTEPKRHTSRPDVGMALELWRCDWSKNPIRGTARADLLLTSPPYADAIDYLLSQRLSLYLMGYSDSDIIQLVSAEIGARRKRFKSTSRSEWAKQLCSALHEQVTWLKPTATICLVLPHKDSGRSEGEVDIKETLAELGWALFFERSRSIHQSHTRQSWTSIKQETIIAFSREA